MTPEIIVSLIGISLIICLIAFAIWLEYKNKKELEEDKNREELKEYLNREVSKPVEPSPTVACEDCKCEVKIENAYEVKVGRKYIDISPNWYYTKHDKSSDPFYYCKRCKPTFSRIELELDCEYYYKELEVNKGGEPVGYKKK